MKNIVQALIFCTLLFLASCMLEGNSKETFTKLPDEGKTVAVKPFTAIKASGVFNVILSQGSKESVVIKGDLPQGLNITNDDKTLILEDTMGGHTHNAHLTIKTDIYITVVDVNNISIESVGETSCHDTLKVKNLDFHSEGVGSTNLWLNGDSVNVSLDGVGKLSIAGKAISANIESAGVGALNATDFKVDMLHLNASGVGSAKVYASKEIYIETSGVGGVEYKGPAKVMQNESSGVGKVEHLD